MGKIFDAKITASFLKHSRETQNDFIIRNLSTTTRVRITRSSTYQEFEYRG